MHESEDNMGVVQSKEDLIKLRESCRQLVKVRVQGEKIEDLQVFDKKEFVESLF